MGNSESSYQQRFYQKYSFVQYLPDRNFGTVKVYRKREVNFDYVMVLDRPFPHHRVTSAKAQLEVIRKSFADEQPPLLLHVFHVDELQNGHCGTQGLRIYLEYLNYSLRDEIQQRKIAFISFSLEQIMYVMQSALATHAYISKLTQTSLILRSDSIFITIEGFLRFSPIRVLDFPQENNCGCFPSSQLQETYFQKSQRQLLIQIKHLLHELVSLCPRHDENFMKSYDLLVRVNQSRTISNLRACLWEPTIQNLSIARKIPESTQISTVRQPSGSFHNSQSGAKSKRSLRESQAHFLRREE